jgi:hypothetical protein
MTLDGADLSTLFEQFMSKFDAFAKMESEWPLFHSGEEFFGLDHGPVKKFIEVQVIRASCPTTDCPLQELPYAFNCYKYKSQHVQ